MTADEYESMLFPRLRISPPGLKSLFARAQAALDRVAAKWPDLGKRKIKEEDGGSLFV